MKDLQVENDKLKEPLTENMLDYAGLEGLLAKNF